MKFAKPTGLYNKLSLLCVYCEHLIQGTIFQGPRKFSITKFHCIFIQAWFSLYFIALVVSLWYRVNFPT